MKRIYSLLLVLIVFTTQSSKAQNDCSSPYLFMSSTTSVYPLVTSMSNAEFGNDYGCLFSQSNVTWLYFEVCNPGSISITITGSGSGSSGTDIDFVAWGPLSASTDCGLDSSQVVDCSMSTSSSETADFTSVVAGQYYKIMISNFSGMPGTVTIAQTGGSGSTCSTGCSAAVVSPQPICQVTNDAVANHNIIIWEKDTTYTGPYHIQKETTTMGTYSTIATVLNSDTSAYEDIGSNPMVQSFKYRIAVSDSCGNIYNGTPPHTTIHLLTTAAFATGYPQLSWNPYVGFGYSTYFIYRGNSPATLALYDSISASFTTYTDVNPAAGMIYYAVAVFPPSPCQPSRAMNHYSLSNVTPFLATGIAEGQLGNFMISPNPAANELNVDFGKNIGTLDISICDVTGKQILESNYSNVSAAKLDVSSLANGYYIIRLRSDKGVAQRKIIISK
ncbi:MAG: hypothetical protein JWO09_3738 [Bacteroidetes bacterium]|nr:hypothetical protein [Bacteroidota bacterium]